MKTALTFCVLFSGLIAFSQSERYGIDLHTGGYQFTKTVVKDYGTHQLTGGSDRFPDGTPYFWFIKMNGEQVSWSKSIPAHNFWAEMDICPQDITECPNGDIVFIARGNNSGNYTAKVVKVSTSGQLIWTKEIMAQPDMYSQTVYENNPMIVENDGIIITLAGYNHLQITKINFDGEVLYSKQLKVQGTLTPFNPGHLFIQNSSGGYYAGFECDNSAAVVSLDHSLNILWSRKITSDEETWSRSLLQLPGGDLLLGGASESDAFVATLHADGSLQDYHRFVHTGLYSADQLFRYNDSTILVNGRTSYGFMNTNTWSFHEMLHNGPLCAFASSATGWSFNGHLSKDYFLDFNPGIPECFTALNVMPFPMSAITATGTSIQATIADMGEVVDIVIPVTDLQATLVNDCYLGLENQSGESFQVSPNPTTGVIRISHPVGVEELTVCDIFGKQVLGIQPQQAKETVIDLSGEAPGMYLIRIDGMQTQRITKQ